MSPVGLMPAGCVLYGVPGISIFVNFDLVAKSLSSSARLFLIIPATSRAIPITVLRHGCILAQGRSGTLYATAKLQARYTLYPAGAQYDQKTFITETLADGTVLPTEGPLESRGVRVIIFR